MSEFPGTYFNSFNARSLRPSDVAKTFVPPKVFRELIKRRHSIIVGPRGTGKTTLLKMLQQSALEHWDHEEAESTRQSVDYTGVFVATDVSWKSQVESLGDRDFTENQRQVFCRAAFTTNILWAVCIAFINRVSNRPAPFPQRRHSISQKQESSIVSEISLAWRIEPSLPTLDSLRHAVTARLVGIREIANRERLLGAAERDERLASIEWLHVSYLPATVAAVEIFNDAVGEPDGLWALLFDELELAPAWIREELIQSLRSVDDRLIFKLSISPYDQHIRPDSILAPMPDNDYEAISLSYSHREDVVTFCESIWSSMARSLDVNFDDPSEILGPSVFDSTSASGGGNPGYSHGSSHHKRFSELARDDSTFAAYIRKKGIDIESLGTGTEDSRAAEVRKIIALVAARHTYRSPDASLRKQKVRSRKNPALYVGARSLFTMVEANPRWLIAIGSRLLSQIGEDGKVPAPVQNRELDIAANRFVAMLRTIPCEANSASHPCGSVASLVEIVGAYLFKVSVLDKFNAEPPGSFLVDEQLDEVVLGSVGKALNAGAVVYIPEGEEDPIVGSLAGKRFRLSYFLAPYFKIPIRLGRPVTLTHIIREMSSKNSRRAESSQTTFIDSE